MASTTEMKPLLEETAFGISQCVQVRLTDLGKQVLNKRVQVIDRVTAVEAERLIDTLYERDGVYEFPLYVFMAIFGPELPTIPVMGNVMFEHNTIVLVPDALDVELNARCLK